MSGKPETARSYRGSVVDDNAVASINLKWLGQLLVLVGMLIYGYYRIETRISSLEADVQSHNDEIETLVSKHIEEEQARYEEMEEDLKWYQKALKKKKK